MTRCPPPPRPPPPRPRPRTRTTRRWACAGGRRCQRARRAAGASKASREPGHNTQHHAARSRPLPPPHAARLRLTRGCLRYDPRFSRSLDLPRRADPSADDRPPAPGGGITGAVRQLVASLSLGRRAAYNSDDEREEEEAEEEEGEAGGGGAGAAGPPLRAWELRWRPGGAGEARATLLADAAGAASLRRAASDAAAASAAAAAAAAAAADDHDEDDDGDAAAAGGARHRRGASSSAPASFSSSSFHAPSSPPRPAALTAPSPIDLVPGPPPAGDACGGASLLGDSAVRSLAAALPGRTRLAAWKLAYSTRRDGTSLRSLLRAAAGRSPTLLAVCDARGAVFGAFAAEPWRVQPRYFGTGETFVFAIVPPGASGFGNAAGGGGSGETGGSGGGDAADGSSPSPSSAAPPAAAAPPPSDAPMSPPRSPPARGVVRLWKWARRNDYFQLASPDGVAVGGGGAFAFRLEEGLRTGTAGACDTFACPRLASGDAFDIASVELWAFD